MTSYASLETAVLALRSGAYDYLIKPFEELDLVTAAVSRAVERATFLREMKIMTETIARKNEELKVANRALADRANRDGLTGLYNHAYFQEVLAREASRAGRYKRVFTLLFADIDHFKQYNDREGHQAGDKAIVMVAEILRKLTRKSDYVARYGGEEFVILLPETAKDRSRIVAGRICSTIEHSPFPGEEGQPGGALTISMGIAAFPDDAVLPMDLIRLADAALFTAKRDGGNAYRMAG